MFNSLIILLLLTLTLSGCGKSNGKNHLFDARTQSGDVVYGEDGRVEPFEMDGTIWKKLSNSVATRVSLNMLPDVSGSNDHKIEIETLKDSIRLCEGEKFAKQNLLGTCSGFLVEKDILVTAGHCIMSEADCTDQAWVFDYELKSFYDESYTSVPKKNVYRCKKIIKNVYGKDLSGSKMDYAVIQLTRPAIDREPLQYRKEGAIKLNTPVVVIGYPSGLPLKITDGGQVRMNSGKNYFSGDLDTFSRNSGSPVFNKETGVVEGILVRGQQDYSYEREGSCYRVNVVDDLCEGDKCKMEEVTRITVVEGL